MNRLAKALVLGAAFLLPACIHVGIGGKKDKDAPVERFHVLEAPPPAASPAPEAGAALPVVGVRAFRIADRFARHVVRRDGPGVATPLDHELWADEPFVAVTELVKETLARSGRVRAAVDAVDAHEVDVLLQGHLQELSVEMPGTQPARALLRVRLTWSDPRTGRVLRTAVHEAAEPLPGPDAAGLGPAMAQAVVRVVGEAIAGGIPLPVPAPGASLPPR